MVQGDNPLSVEARKNRSVLLYGLSIAVMVIIGVSLIGTLAPTGGGRAGGPLVFGTFDGREITFSPTNYFGASYDSYRRRYATQQFEDDDQLALLRAIWSGAYRDTVLHTAMVQVALAGGAHVSERRVDQTLIDSVSYENLQQMPAPTREGNLERLRELLLRQRYVNDVTAGRYSSNDEIAFYEGMLADERRFEFISIAYDAYPDEELARYGQANAADFRRIDLSRILVEGGAEAAAQIHQRITSGTATFEDQARAHSQDEFAEQGGDIGFRYFFDLALDFDDLQDAEQVFALADGAVSAVLQGRFGHVIYRADSRVIEPDFADPDTLAVVRAYLNQNERGLVEDYFLARADRFKVAASQADFHTAAADLDLTVHSTEWFPINYQNATSLRPVAASGGSGLLAGAAALPEFFLGAFALQRPGDVSVPIRLRDSVIVLRLLEEREASPEDLRNAAGDSMFEWFTSRALDSDLQVWVYSSELLEDNFEEAFAATLRTGG